MDMMPGKVPGAVSSQTQCPHAGGWAQDCIICLTIRLCSLKSVVERLLAVVEHRVDHTNCPDGQNCREPELAAIAARAALTAEGT